MQSVRCLNVPPRIYAESQDSTQTNSNRRNHQLYVKQSYMKYWLTIFSTTLPTYLVEKKIVFSAVLLFEVSHPEQDRSKNEFCQLNVRAKFLKEQQIADCIYDLSG